MMMKYERLKVWRAYAAYQDEKRPLQFNDARGNHDAESLRSENDSFVKS